MTVYSPLYSVQIAGIEYADEVIQNIVITKGRNDLFSATLASYCVVEILNIDNFNVDIELMDDIIISITDSNGDFQPLFTGEVEAVTNESLGAGNIGHVSGFRVRGLGALSKLVRRTAGRTNYPQELDGQRITRILEEALFVTWAKTPATLIWDDVDEFQEWADYGVQDIDRVDEGRFELIQRPLEIENAYFLAELAERSGLGYLYETNTGEIGYADANRRTQEIGTNAVAIDSNLLNAQMETRLELKDIINQATVFYNDKTEDVQAVNDLSVEDYGLLESIIDTELAQEADALEQAIRLVALRGNPQVNFEEVTINLVNDNIGDELRDRLLDVDMDTLMILDNLPAGVYNQAEFRGYVEGWTWFLSKNNVELTMSLSDDIYSAFETQWQFYEENVQWQNLPNILQWQDLAIG